MVIPRQTVTAGDGATMLEFKNLSEKVFNTDFEFFGGISRYVKCVLIFAGKFRKSRDRQ